MKLLLQKIRRGLNTKLGFFLLVVFLFAIKSYWAYQTKFNLGVSGAVQEFLLAFNTIPATLLFIGIALYFRGRLSYWLMIIINALLSTWLFANILYYREFSDFITLNVIKGSGTSSGNLGTSLGQIIRPSDFFVYADVILLILLLAFHLIRIDMRYFKRRYSLTISALAFLLFGVNLGMAESDRSQLLTRTFDNNYLVKYLGLEAYTIYDGVKTTHTSMVRSQASSKDLTPILNYIKKNYAAPNMQYYGTIKGKNIIIVHLESFQQFLINYKVNGQEVTPNINSLYNSSNSISFSNFFNQVGQGKTSDAEMMLENSLYGLPEGSAMSTLGTSNTFQAAPALLEQKLGYTTASFHGDTPSFWNRDNTYKSFGYQYFFSKDFFPEVKDSDVGYGTKDKLFMKYAAHYLQQLPQPFYAKLITVTNHYPYLIDKKNTDFPELTTGDNTVDPYVQTAHYLDQAVGELLTYLDETGLRKNTVLVLYGDHYGISENHKDAIAKILGKKSVTNYDLAMWQKVPLIINGEGISGGINETYGDEIDVLPTLEDLLGISSNKYIQFGQDLLSSENDQIVPFRNGSWVTPQYTKYGGQYFYTKSGKQIKNPTAAQKKKFKAIQKQVTTELGLSDKVLNGDLLRFYKLSGFTKVNKKNFTYNVKKSLSSLKKIQEKLKTSLYYQNDKKDTDYSTDAPELTSSTFLKYPTK